VSAAKVGWPILAAAAFQAGLRTVALISGACTILSAHVGSPDVFFQGKAGPYSLLVAIRPPDVIPGIARIEVRSLSNGVREIQLTPTPMTGPAASHPPVADIAERSKTDPQLFDGALWLMSAGAWEVHIRVSGTQGAGELPVPVPAMALKMKPMQRGVSAFLVGMMIFLTVGVVAIVGAGVREAQLRPGVEDPPQWSRKAVVAMACASIVIVFALWRGSIWWGEDDATNRRKLYKPLELSASLDKPDHMQLHLTDPGWLPLRKIDDLVPDHGHIMHLFLVRWPAMDRVYHLHPEQGAAGIFETPLPSIPAGSYRVYGDIVHDNGLAETAVGEMPLPDVKGQPLTGDDAAGPSLPASGFSMIWIHDPSKPIAATQLNLFSFEIAGSDGKPVNDLEPYMGMGGHAEFIKTDGSVFAHVHPTGSIPMASVAVASPEAMLAMHETKPGPVVSFPYGVPTPGKYRVFVQMKRAGKVETGAFEFTASPASPASLSATLSK
jgi:hypothetical protein